MRSVSVRLADLDRVKINLGFAGENEHTHVLFDCKKAFDQYPNATPFLIVTPPRGDIYPAVVTRDGDIVEWVVTDSDLIYHGNGKVQLQFKQGDIIMKSYEAMTSIAKSSEPTGTVPTPIQNWITQANAILAAIPDDIAAALAEAKASGQFDGVGIASIAYKSTSGLVDTYTITLTDGNTYDFAVMNGTPGQNGVGIQSIAKTSTVGLVDTYTVTLTNGHTYPFTVTNGQNGVEIDDNTPANNKVFSSAKVAEELTDVKSAIQGMTTATASDVGKALSPKTVTDGEVTEWQFVEGGGGSVDPSVVEQKVDEWLDENITNPNSPPLDRSLSSSSGAIPADIGGEIVKNMDVVTVPHSANLWDDAHKNAGWYHKNGTIYDYAGYYYFDIGAVSENDVIKCFIVSGSTVIEATMYAVVALDSNGDIVSAKSTESVSTFTVPSGVAKLVITIKNPPESTMIVNSIPKPSAFIQYYDSYSYYVAGEGFVPKEAIPFIVEKDGEGQVTAKNLQIIDYSHNLFDLSAITENYLVNQASGELNAASGHSASDWIPVEEGEKYTFSINEAKEVRYVWYTASKTYISGTLDNSLEVETLTAPTNAAYFRFSTTAIKRLYIQFEKGEEATPYRDYGEAFIKPQYKTSADQFVLNLPSKIYATTGIELNIYFENLVEDWTKYDWDVKCNRGRQMERGYVYTPVDGDAGTRDITITATNGNVSVSKTATMIVTAKSAGDGDNVSVIVLGDSTTANGTAVTKLAGNFADDPMSITLCGTKGTSPYLHEGRSGWTFYNYVNTLSDNAFCNPSTNKFDAAYYFTNTGVEKPDWFFINLGINDTFGSVNDREVMDECSKIKSRCDYIINSILDASPSTKIGLCITIPPNHSQDAFGKDYNCGQTRNRYKRNNVMWVDFLIGEYDGKESEGIYLIPIYTNLDTVYNMGTESNPVNARNTATTYMSATTNGGVHPVESGYWQIADVYTAFLKANG